MKEEKQNKFYERKSRKQNQLNNTKKWITEAYLKLLTQQPDKNISISNICSEAGVGRQTFYRHFSGTEGIILREMDRVLSELKEEVLKIGEKPVSDYQVFLLVFKKWQENHHLLPMKESQHFYSKYLLHFQLFRRFLEEEVEFPKIELDYVRHYRQGGINAVFFNWLNDGMNDEPETMAQLLIDHCL